ncbi:MAG: hypothetical protein M1830_002699 [Pleopsidium flavum]|nr:MAG: hypothetical protein M1830_002699 [Pleopsidium flavum]
MSSVLCDSGKRKAVGDALGPGHAKFKRPNAGGKGRALPQLQAAISHDKTSTDLSNRGSSLRKTFDELKLERRQREEETIRVAGPHDGDLQNIPADKDLETLTQQLQQIDVEYHAQASDYPEQFRKDSGTSERIQKLGLSLLGGSDPDIMALISEAHATGTKPKYLVLCDLYKGTVSLLRERIRRAYFWAWRMKVFFTIQHSRATKKFDPVIADRDSQINVLQEKVDGFTKRQNEQDANSSTMRDKIAALELQLSNLWVEQQSLTARNNANQHVTTEKDARIAVQGARISELEGQTTAQSESIKTLKLNNNTILSNQQSAYKTIITGLKTDIATKDRNYDLLKSQYDCVKEDFTRVEAEKTRAFEHALHLSNGQATMADDILRIKERAIDMADKARSDLKQAKEKHIQERKESEERHAQETRTRVQDRDKIWLLHLEDACNINPALDLWNFERLGIDTTPIELADVPRETVQILLGSSPLWCYTPSLGSGNMSLKMGRRILKARLRLQERNIHTLTQYLHRIYDMWYIWETDASLPMLSRTILFPLLFDLVSEIVAARQKGNVQSLAVWLAIQLGCSLLRYVPSAFVPCKLRVPLEAMLANENCLVESAIHRFMLTEDHIGLGRQVMQDESPYRCLNGLASKGRQGLESFVCKDADGKTIRVCILVCSGKEVHLEVEIGSSMSIWHGRIDDIAIFVGGGFILWLGFLKTMKFWEIIAHRGESFLDWAKAEKLWQESQPLDFVRWRGHQFGGL